VSRGCNNHLDVVPLPAPLELWLLAIAHQLPYQLQTCCTYAEYQNPNNNLLHLFPKGFHQSQGLPKVNLQIFLEFPEYPSRHLKRFIFLKFFKQLSRWLVQSASACNHHITRKVLIHHFTKEANAMLIDRCSVANTEQPDNECFSHERMN